MEIPLEVARAVSDSLRWSDSPEGDAWWRSFADHGSGAGPIPPADCMTQAQELKAIAKSTGSLKLRYAAFRVKCIAKERVKLFGLRNRGRSRHSDEYRAAELAGSFQTEKGRRFLRVALNQMEVLP